MDESQFSHSEPVPDDLGPVAPLAPKAPSGTAAAQSPEQEVVSPRMSVYQRQGNIPPRFRRRFPIFGALLGVFVALFVVLLLSYLVPFFAENLQYALTRGRQRAEYEAAGTQLKNSSLQELSGAYQLISQRVVPSVVHINTVSLEEPRRTEWSPRGRREPRSFHELSGQGSGVIIDAEGYILTNAHVVADAQSIEVRLSDGRHVEARLIQKDSRTDLAVIKVDGEKNLIAAEWGSSSDTKKGSLVWAVGSPFGLDQSITFGILSAKNRNDFGPDGLFRNFLQSDVAVNPGNSGGPLVDVAGRVIGINTAILGTSYQGISFAIPSEIARKVYETLKKGERVTRGFLGVQPRRVTAEAAEEAGLEWPHGALVSEVVVIDELNPSPAMLAGVEAGDVIVEWNGKPIDSPFDLITHVAGTTIGTECEFVVHRGQERLNLKAVVAAHPEG